jgi:hypothetical protein
MLWDGKPSWTDEDDQASHDEFDPRPALLIHNIGQTDGRTEERPMPILYVHAAIEDVLQGRAVQP